MTKEIEDIIIEKPFEELSSKEREEVSQFVESEDEYTMMRRILITAPTIGDDIQPSPELKQDLTAMFNQHHAATANNDKKAGFWNNNWVMTIAAILLLCLLVYPFVNSNNILESNGQVLVAKNDTPKVEVPAAKNENEMPTIDKSEKADKEQLWLKK